MYIVDLDSLTERLEPGQRLLGVDLGSKTIGLALSDTELTVASPLRTLKRGKFGDDAVMLKSLILAYDVGGLILGLPLNLDGSRGRKNEAEEA